MTPTPPDLTPDGSSIFGRLLNATTDRLSLDAWLAPVAGFGPASSLTEIDAALVFMREQIPGDIDDLTRATMRAAVKDALKDTKTTTAMVDAALAKPPKATKEHQTATLVPAVALVHDDEPWPDAVDGRAVLEEVAATVRKYIVLPPAAIDAVALWVAFAGCLAAATIMPLLAIVAATMRAGKSTLAEIVQVLAPRGVLVSNMTPAVLFRLIDSHCPTLIADEADTWLSDEKSELRGIFNSGHSRATAAVARCVGDDHNIKIFSTWAPKVIAMIGRPPATVVDRSILIHLQRKRADEQVDRLRRDRLTASALPIRRRLRRWADDHLDDLRLADPETPAALHDRAADNWRGLLAVADLAGGDWPTRARRAAIAASAAEAAEAENVKIELLADIRAIFADRAEDALSSTEMVAGLGAMTERPWAEWSQGRPLSAAKLARLLKPFGAVPFDIKVAGKTLKRYRRDAFIDAWTRYLPAEVQPRNPANVYASQTAESEVQPERGGCTSKRATGPMNTDSGCEVAFSTADLEASAGIDASDGIF